MPGRLTTLIVVSFWGAMMALLVRNEVLPRWQASAGVDLLRESRSSIEYDRPVRWRLLRDGHDVGSAVTWWERGANEIAIYNAHVELHELPVAFFGDGMGEENQWRSRTRTYVDADGSLRSFETDVWLGDTLLAQVRGSRVEDRLEVRVNVGRFEQKLQFFFDPEAMWSGGLLPPDRYGPLRVGDKWTLKTVNPMRGTPELVLCEVVGEDTVRWRGREVKVFKVRQRSGVASTEAWVTEKGDVLRQTLPFGWATYVAERVSEQP